jgi:Ca-activated chloride channel family protein
MSPGLDHPNVLAAAPLIGAVVTGLVVLIHGRQERRLGRFGSPHLIGRLVPRAARLAPWPRAALLGIGVTCALVAFAGPRWGIEGTVVRAGGADIILSLDVSLSMLAPDVRPNRLEQMKAEARRFLAQAGDDRVGLLAFAGRGYVLSPLTRDREALALFLHDLHPSSVGQAGSSLTQAIRRGADLLRAGGGEGGRAVVILSDCEAHEPEAEVVTAARSAAQAGVALVMVGFGTTTGTSIPLETAEGTVPKRDENGRIVVTRYNPAYCSAVAKASGGTFIDAARVDKASLVRGAVAHLHSVSHPAEPGPTRRARFQLFLAPALVLILAGSLLADRRVRRGVVPRTASLAAAGLLMAAAWPVAPGHDGSDAARFFRAGRYAEAAAAFQRAVELGDRSSRMLYNLGTALLAADRGQDAAARLREAANSGDREIRFRALFNLGLTHLRQGAALAGDSAERAYAAAVDAYRAALRVRPSSFDATWNYELAHRRLSESRRRRESETVIRAEQLLDRAAAEPLEARRQWRARVEPTHGKDW